MEEYGRLMHALTIQTLEHHLNDSIVNSCIKEYSGNKESNLVRTSKRKSLWPLPIQFLLPRPENESNDENSQIPLLEKPVMEMDDHHIGASYHEGYENNLKSQTPSSDTDSLPLVIRAYDYDTFQHMSVYENIDLRASLAKLVQKKLDNNILPPEIYNTTYALLLRSSLEIAEEMLEMMGSLREYIQEANWDHFNIYLRHGNHNTVLRAAKLIRLDPQVIRRTEARIKSILGQKEESMEDSNSQIDST
jgi:hypothetical protein